MAALTRHHSNSPYHRCRRDEPAMDTPIDPGLAPAATPMGESLVPFLHVSAHRWSAITGEVDPDAIIIFGLVEALARTWKEIHTKALAVYDLNLAEWTAIGMLRSSPPDFRRSPTELRRLVGQTSAGMTRVLTKLVDTGLVRRQPSPSDGRGQDVILTRKGKALSEESFRGMHAIQRGLLAPLTSDTRDRFIAALDELRLTLLPGPVPAD
jgi:DNA-binding MarR family transcriptional regulator